MQRLLASILACLLLAACESSSELPDVDWPEASPALWLVEDEEGRQGYLFGTMHALPDGVEWRTPLFEQALADADILLVEIANLEDSSEATRAFANVAYSDGLPPLLSRLEEPDRAQLAELLQRANAQQNDFAEMESWAAAMSLSASVRLGEPENGVDRAIIDAGKPVQGLESFAAQFAIFDTLDEDDQTELLAAIARESVRDKQVEAISAWLSGDLEALSRMGAAGIMGDAELRQTLVEERNVAWLEQIARQIGEGHRPLLAVGAGHMLGESGLPALLSARGYAVTRLQ